MGKAHERNRIKRRMREALRRHIDLLPAGFDLILHPRRTVLTMEFAQLEARNCAYPSTSRGRGGALRQALRIRSSGGARIMTRILLALLAFYKRWLSPALHSLHPGGCKFLPTCSEYAPRPSRYTVLCAALASPPGDCCAAIPLRAGDSIPSRRRGTTGLAHSNQPEFTLLTIAPEPFPPTNRDLNRYHK